MIRDEQEALKQIASLLPTGYVKIVPYSVSSDVTFEYHGVSVEMSKLRLNEALNCYMFDLAWGASNKIFGIPVRCGIDILKQYSTPLPNMYATNHAFPGQEVTSWRQLNIFLIDESVLERGQSN